MDKFFIFPAVLLIAGGVLACSNMQNAAVTFAASPKGQLFCSLETSAGGQMIVGIIDAQASAAGPVAVLAANATAEMVKADCAAAAASTGAVSGLPVSPPTASVATVAIVPPIGTAPKS